jgi:hypothetical protein
MKNHPSYRPIDPRHRIISRHSNFDDTHPWTFPRRLCPPARRNEFNKGWTVDRIVFVVCVVLLALGVIAANLGGAR